MEYLIFYIHVEPYIVGKLGYISQLLMRYYCNLSCTEHVFFFIYSTAYLASPNKTFYRIQTQKFDRCRTSHTHTTHKTTHKNKMSRCLPTPSSFALYLHGNICHGPKSWCRGSPRVCCRRLAVGLLMPQLVLLVGMPNKDSSKNREGDGSLALGGRRLVLRRNNQPIVVAAIGGMMERMRGQGGVCGGGGGLLFGGGELIGKKNYKNKKQQRH
jgi:hypothetical protein